MQAVIMAGGKGTRLWSVAKDIPKPMFPILGKPIIEYQIESLKKSSITEITIIVGHLGRVIKDYFRDGRRFGVNISYITEDEPLGTAGALYYLKDMAQGDFVLVFGDLILDIDWDRFMDFHKKSNAVITLYGHPNAHPYDSDLIVTDEKGKVIRIEPKSSERNFFCHNFVNAGVYCVSPELLKAINAPRKIDLEKGLISEQINKGKAYVYKSSEYVKDIGTPDRLEDVSRDIEKGIVKSRSLRNKQRAIFLDRDGTVNVLKGFLKSAEDFELLPNAAEAIHVINTSGYLVIVVTNQPVIARGECTFEEMERIHMKMEKELGEKGAYIDDLFFCPHHPDKGFEGEVPELKFECACRKPKIGMLRMAEDKYNIDLGNSWYVGDTTLDIQTGENAGMRTVLVLTGEAGRDGKFPARANYVAKDLLDAVGIILRQG